MRLTNSNWEAAIFCIVNEIADNKGYFSRQEMITSHYKDMALAFSLIHLQKKNPKHIEETIQRSLQNMRDKDFVNFLGDGQYRLTEAGKIEMKKSLDLYFNLWDVLKDKEFRKRAIDTLNNLKQ